MFTDSIVQAVTGTINGIIFQIKLNAVFLCSSDVSNINYYLLSDHWLTNISYLS